MGVTARQFVDKALSYEGYREKNYFVDGIAVILTGSRDAAKRLLCQDGLTRMSGYTPDGAACYIDAGRWTYSPEIGDVIYFWSQSKGRIGHVGIVYDVDKANQIVYTIEGNTNTFERPDGDVETNGGTVGRHAYDYSNAGQAGAAVQGFGRPRFSEALPDGVYFQIGG